MPLYAVVAVLSLVCRPSLGGTVVCLKGDFDAQVGQVIDAQQMPQEQFDKAITIFDDIKRTMQRKWKDVEIYPFGSLVTGIAFKSSDADCLAKVPSENDTAYILLQTAHLMEQEPDIYQNVIRETYKVVPVLTFHHVPANRSGDLSFTAPSSVDNSRVMQYFFHLDERIMKMAFLLKSWSRRHRIRKSGIVPSYSLSLLFIFYLQQKQMAPPMVSLQERSAAAEWDGWDTHFNRIPYTSNNTETVFQLLRGFFDYYSNFDFEYNVVSPYIGRAIPRDVFRNVSALPEEFVRYKQFLRRAHVLPLNLEPRICVQDLIVLCTNVIDVVDDYIMGNFISLVKLSARMFAELASDHVLSNLLRNQTVQEYESRADTFDTQCVQLR